MAPAGSGEAIAPRRVLVLYWSATPPSGIRAAIRHHLQALERGPSRHELTYHNVLDRLPGAVRDASYDAIVLHTTMLCLRWFDDFERWRERLAWVAKADALKIAMPQDEYNHAAVLDDWLASLGVEHVFSVFGEDERRVLYPVTAQRAAFHHAFTGYVDEDTAQRLESRLPDARDRPFDVVYRATRLPFWLGGLGQLKHRIAERALNEVGPRGVKADISTRTEDSVLGDEWFDFLAVGRAVIGAESGSSVLDRRGETRAEVQRLLQDHPGASFDEVSRLMPEGWDSHHFGALSPRHFEAVITRTGQILVRGGYEGVLEAGIHYVPVKPDLSDLGQALEQAKDPAVTARVADAAYEEIYRSGRYTYRVLAQALDRVLETRAPKPAAASRHRPAPLASERPAGSRGLTVATVTAMPAADARRTSVGRRLLAAYRHAGGAKTSISMPRLAGEAVLLARIAAAQRAQPGTPGSRAVKASWTDGSLLITAARRVSASTSDASDAPGASWPPREIHVRIDSYTTLLAETLLELPAEGVRMEAVEALARLEATRVAQALAPLLDDIGGARSRPALRGVKNHVKSALGTARALATRDGVAALAAGAGRVPLREIADDLFKLSLARANGGVRTCGTDQGRLVWDNSTVADHVVASVPFGGRLTVHVGAAGVHEFTALQRLPASAKRRVLRGAAGRVSRGAGGV